MDYQKIVSDAAKWLDSVEPGWWRRIDKGNFNIRFCTQCILGQLYGEFTKGLNKHGLSVWGTDKLSLAFNGMLSDGNRSHPDKKFNFLQPLWLAEIEFRLNADKQDNQSSVDRFIERTNEIINQTVEVNV